MPRIYVKKGTRTGEVDEDAMNSAIKEVVEKTLSIRKSAYKYGVKPTTLESRLKKLKEAAGEGNTQGRVFSSKYSSNQVFTIEEETALNNYITRCSKMHYGLTIIQVRKLAYEYAKANNLHYPQSWDHNKMAGKEWLDSYRRRNANLSLRKPENTSAARSFGFNKTAVNDFFRNLQEVYTKYKFTADRIYNYDESGISTVMSTPKILAEKKQKQIGQLVSAERGELVTFGGIISASGNTIPPLFIFPRVHFKDHFMDGAPEGSLGVATKTGWINSNIFLKVLRHIQKITLCTKDNPILLLADNHESHVTIEAVDYARDNGIVYLSFPPHTTHRLQPLDVGVFGPFKAKLKTAFNDWHINHSGKTLNIYNIPKLAKIAYFESFNSKNITSAFAKTGIWPFNKLAFSDADFDAVTVYQSKSTLDPDNDREQIISEEVDEHDLLPMLGQASTTLAKQQEMHPSSTEDQTLRADTESQQNVPQTSGNISPSLLSPSTSSKPLSATGLITPEMVKPFPRVDKTERKSKKGKLPGKSRIYTYTPEKNRLEEIEKAKKLKKEEQERKRMAKEKKRVLNLLSDTETATKPQGVIKPKKRKTLKQKTDSEDETDCEDIISFRESSCSPIEESFEVSDLENDNVVLTENIKEGGFVLVKFEKKKTVLYYVGQVMKKYSPTEYHVSFLRKKSKGWAFVFPNIKDEGTVYLTDVVSILSLSRPALTARTANIFNI